MDLQKLVESRKQALTIWVRFSDLFDIELEYADRPLMRQLLEKSKQRAWEKHRPVESISDEQFDKNLAGLIRNWRGLTLRVLAKLTNIDISGEDPDREIPCTKENKKVLVAEAWGLNNFIQETVTDLEQYRLAQLEGELKNSKASQESE